jgi:alkylation response protein AidB-like acyl-CoA dehydrogenase
VSTTAEAATTAAAAAPADAVPAEPRKLTYDPAEIVLSEGRRSVLTPPLLDRFGERAAGYDRENRFFGEDFEELREAGYLRMAIPGDLGGLGLALPQVCREQRRLAYRAPATALATNMHLYWTGVAADMRRRGDSSLQWLLEEAASGEVFAAGHGETGNDLPLLYSTSKAERVDGGYRFTGHKIFSSLTPVWTRLGLHAVDDTSDPESPKIVHAFLPRDTPGIRIKETWDTLGMRATRSDDTLLEGVFVPDRYIARVVPAGFAGADLFILSIFAWSQPTFANIYVGIAQRARDLAVEGIHHKTSVGGMTRTMAYHPEIQHMAALMSLELEAMVPHVERIADDWAGGIDHGPDWPMKLVAAKYRCVEGAKKVVDVAMDMSGGAGMFKRSELERLYRDVRCGGFHPANSALVHEIVGKSTLGVLGAPGARWG